MNNLLCPQDQPGTSTITTAPSEEQQSLENTQTLNSNTDGVLRLRGVQTERRRVAWTEEVVDNEGLGRKKTKICCIYNKPRDFGESSSEESESSSSDEDNEPEKTKRDVSAKGNNETHLENRHHTCGQHGEKHQRRKNAYERRPNQQRKAT
ncbi:hypothetical protein H072_2793 [Dactylellina haptotyla CBS 200.50]|uniref:Type 1 phosphatases regulator n=1 Tax=Dactylellina haptotyla (strain CBS 200.50) TaxID=1284197 RepID=S8C677_DACHA|nr:hypothetical protein H072_2793 [Dactylellina haptotyla CBS 200.50]